MNTTRPTASILLMVAALSGCNALLPKRSVPPEGETPERFSLGGAGETPSRQWWRDFESDALNALVNEALEENLSLRQLWARLDQAGSVAVQVASNLYPQLDGLGDASYRRTVTKVDVDEPSFRSRIRDAALSGLTRGLTNAVNQQLGTAGGSSGGTSSGGTGGVSVGTGQAGEIAPSRLITEVKQFGLSLAAGYELDVWGRVLSEYRAAKFDVVASRDEIDSAALTLAAEVADHWLGILEQQELQRLLAEQLETNQTYLELVELRFRKGLVSALDVYQQRQTVSQIKTQIPLVQAAAQLLRQELAVLLGKPPETDLPVGTYDLSTVPPLPATGVPAELLANRPDIRAALARLQAADYRVASARADLLPAVRLTGGIGYDTAEIRYLFDNWFIGLAGGLTQPLFDGFRRTAEIDRTLALVNERLADYRLVVLVAIQEVEAALVQESKQREHIAALAEQLQDARNTLREAGQRYRKGLNDYLPVLAALERTQALARGLIVARRDLLTFRVNLYRALGGTWMNELRPPVRSSDELVLGDNAQS